MDDLIFLAIIGLVGFGIGFGISSLINALRATPEPGQDQNAESVELLQLRRSKTNGQLEVHARGKRLAGFSTLSAAGQETVLRILAEFTTWVGEKAQAKPEVPAAAPVIAATSQQAASETLAPLPRPTAVSAAPPPAGQPGPVTPPNLNIVSILSRAVIPPARAKPAPAFSLAAQVDEILQEKLAQPENASLAAQGVHLVDHPTQGMLVVVGPVQYEGIDSVPDPMIRNLIRQCVKEWETRLS